jgi:DNA-binding IscR family transcriptional regulator
MRRDSRLSVALHVLLHMGESSEPFTSERIGQMLEANPVVLRRTLARLKAARLVSAAKGHGGGWLLAKPLGKVRLSEVYAALETSSPFAIAPRTESPGCLIERAVNRTISGALDEAERVLLRSFERLTLDAIAKDVHRQAGKRRSVT